MSKSIVDELKQYGSINCYQYSKEEWAKISKVLRLLKRWGLVYTEQEDIRGGAGGELRVTTWKLVKV